MKPVVMVTIVIMGILAGGPAAAEIIFGTETVEYGHALLSDWDWDQEVVDDFVLQPGLNAVADVHWWGAYFESGTPANDEFTIRIFGGSENTPDLTPLYEFTGLSGNRVDTGVDHNYQSGPARIYAYSADIPVTLLAPNETYWIAILNDTTDDEDDHWYWVGSNNALDPEVWYRFGPDEDWNTVPMDTAFYLTGPVVPEPASMTLLSLGFAAIATRLARAQRKPA